MNKLLILDLDETLIHSDECCIHTDAMSFKINIISGSAGLEEFNVYMRPGLKDFLNYCLDNFRVAIWSAGIAEYVEEITNYIFAERKKRIIICLVKK